jgi:regulator of replication initiation timing
VAVFNEVYERTGSEAEAMKQANGAVKATRTRLEAVRLRVVEDRSAVGRGGTVEMPLAIETRGIRSQHTAGGGEGTFDMDASVFSEVIRNFNAVPGPVPVYFGHIADDERRTTPAAGYVRAVWLEPPHLWGRVDLGPSAWEAVVEKQGFRSFSVEIERDPKLPAADLSGWTLTGGAITNTPALDVEYIAASTDGERGETICLHLEADRMEFDMDDQIKTLRAELKDKESEIDALEAKLNTLTAEVAEAQRKTEEAESEKAKLEKSNETLSERVANMGEQVAALRKQQETDELTRKVEQAIDACKDASWFEGFDEAEDKLAWADENYGGTKALFKLIEKLPTVKAEKVSAGAAETETGDPAEVEKEWITEVGKFAAAENLSFEVAEKRVRDLKPELYEQFKASRGAA